MAWVGVKWIFKAEGREFTKAKKEASIWPIKYIEVNPDGWSREPGIMTAQRQGWVQYALKGHAKV